MVVFTCNHCGESLRKPTVEKHYNFCRAVKSLTCVDCFKDFRDEEYVTHTKCITEEERYAAKGSMPMGVVKKGELKQESWVDMIKSILDQSNLKPSHRNLLNTICSYSNIPRKKPKFMNFIKSSSGGRVNMREVEEVWNIIESYKSNKATKQNNAQDNKSNGDLKSENGVNKRKKNEDVSNENVELEEPKKKKKKKEKITGQVDDANLPRKNALVEEAIEDEKFSYNNTIINILEKKKTISLQKLQKKVINAYLKHSGESEASPKIIKKFNKKLKKIDNIEISDDKVSLKEIS